MSRLLSAVMAAVTLSSGFAALSVSADDRAVGVVLYVSPSGDDSAVGTLSAPLRTLEGARDAVRELRRDGDPEGGITVYLREGVYYQPQTLELTEEDRDLPDNICGIQRRERYCHRRIFARSV